MRCQHPRLIYTEHVPSETVWFFIDGDISGDPVNNAKRVQVVEVYCELCQFARTYQLATAPQWVKDLRAKVYHRFEAIGEERKG